MIDLEEKKYKIQFIPEIGRSAQFTREYNTYKEACAALDAIADYTLMLHECGYMVDHSNIGVLSKRDECGRWVEVDENDEERL